MFFIVEQFLVLEDSVGNIVQAHTGGQRGEETSKQHS